jgi:hypothetical protein
MGSEEQTRGFSKKAIDTGNILSSLKAELEKLRKPLVDAMVKKLGAGGDMPTSVQDLEALCALPSLLRTLLTRNIASQRVSSAIVIRAFLELLDREGAIAFPPIDAETKREVRRARKAMEQYF